MGLVVLRYRTWSPPRDPKASIRCTYVISTPAAFRASLVQAQDPLLLHTPSLQNHLVG